MWLVGLSLGGGAAGAPPMKVDGEWRKPATGYDLLKRCSNSTGIRFLLLGTWILTTWPDPSRSLALRQGKSLETDERNLETGFPILYGLRNRSRRGILPGNAPEKWDWDPNSDLTPTEGSLKPPASFRERRDTAPAKCSSRCGRRTGLRRAAVRWDRCSLRSGSRSWVKLFPACQQWGFGFRTGFKGR